MNTSEKIVRKSNNARETKVEEERRETKSIYGVITFKTKQNNTEQKEKNMWDVVMGLVSLWKVVCIIGGILLTVSMMAYLLPMIYLSIAQRQERRDMRKEYGEWALVTGASSGIGRAIADKLLNQNVNVILVALDDALLKSTVHDFQARYRQLEIRVVRVDLSDLSTKEYMNKIRAASDDVHVGMVFNNAGFLVMGYFEQHSIDTHLRNLMCNATAGVCIIHHFYKRMVERRSKACIVITSSAVCFMVRFMIFSCLG